MGSRRYRGSRSQDITYLRSVRLGLLGASRHVAGDFVGVASHQAILHPKKLLFVGLLIGMF